MSGKYRANLQSYMAISMLNNVYKSVNIPSSNVILMILPSNTAALHFAPSSQLPSGSMQPSLTATKAP